MNRRYNIIRTDGQPLKEEARRTDLVKELGKFFSPQDAITIVVHFLKYRFDVFALVHVRINDHHVMQLKECHHAGINIYLK